MMIDTHYWIFCQICLYDYFWAILQFGKVNKLVRNALSSY